MGILKKLKKKKKDKKDFSKAKREQNSKSILLQKKMISKEETPTEVRQPKRKQITKLKGEASTWQRVKNTFKGGGIIQHD
jgi:hypothetical protein